jgi:ankyrin repeat protein
MACYNGHIEIVQLLLNNGSTADLGREDSDGTPKANAESEGHTAVVDLLSQYT